MRKTISERSAKTKVERGDTEIEIEAKEVLESGEFITKAKCPYCDTVNKNPEDGGTKCKHFVTEIGGCGAYAFIFRKKS